MCNSKNNLNNCVWFCWQTLDAFWGHTIRKWFVSIFENVFKIFYMCWTVYYWNQSYIIVCHGKCSKSKFLTLRRLTLLGPGGTLCPPCHLYAYNRANTQTSALKKVTFPNYEYGKGHYAFYPIILSRFGEKKKSSSKIPKFP